MMSQKFSSNKTAKTSDLKFAFKGNIVPSLIMLLLCAYKFIFSVFSAFKNSYCGYDTLLTSSTDVREFNKAHTIAILVSQQSTSFIVLSLAFCGALFALFSFSYMMKKKSVNFFYSSPVTRSDMFKNRIVSSVVCMGAILLLTITADVIINAYYVKNIGYVINLALSLFAGIFVNIQCPRCLFSNFWY